MLFKLVNGTFVSFRKLLAEKMAGLESSHETQFMSQLVAKYNAKKGVLMKKEEYYELIEQLKEASSTESKTQRQFYILRRQVFHITRIINDCYCKYYLDIVTTVRLLMVFSI